MYPDHTTPVTQQVQTSPLCVPASFILDPVPGVARQYHCLHCHQLFDDNQFWWHIHVELAFPCSAACQCSSCVVQVELGLLNADISGHHTEGLGDVGMDIDGVDGALEALQHVGVYESLPEQSSETVVQHTAYPFCSQVEASNQRRFDSLEPEGYVRDTSPEFSDFDASFTEVYDFHNTPTPDLLYGADQTQRISPSTGEPMRNLPILPEHIPYDVEPETLDGWIRQAAAQGLKLEYRDIIDRMEVRPYSDETMAKATVRLRNTLSNRVQRWSKMNGILPASIGRRHGYPSKQVMDTLADLTIDQAKQQSARNAQHFAGQDAHVLQGFEKGGTHYRDRPKSQGLSDEIRFAADAMLFLDIKAAEAGLEGGRNELMGMVQHPDADDASKAWKAEMLADFKRWRASPSRPAPVGVHYGNFVGTDVSAGPDYAVDDGADLFVMDGQMRCWRASGTIPGTKRPRFNEEDQLEGLGKRRKFQ